MKIYFDVKNQIITRTDRNQVIANSADYLEAEITFSAEWATMEKTMTFKNGNLLYTYVLVNDKILEENHLNLGVGTWKVSIQGVNEDKKIVTNECNLAVNASGWIGSEALPPESIWNQLLVIIQSLHTEAASTAALRSAVQKYIEDNYDALVKEEVIVDDVRSALDDMAEDGTLSDLLAPLVAAGMPEVVADQISAVVAAQIGDTVASQIGAVVASQITAPVNQAVKDYCDDNFSGWSGGLDRGLTQPLMAAPADLVGGLKSALHEVVDESEDWVNIPLTVHTDGYYSIYGAFNSDPTRRYAIITDVAEGEEYRLNTYLSSTLIPAVLYFHDNSFIDYRKKGTGEPEDVVNYEFTIPENCNKIIVQNAKSGGTFTLEKYSTVYTSKSYTKAQTDSIISEHCNKKYGLKWNNADATDLGSRCFDAVGLTAIIGKGATDGSSDFDSIYPWSEIKRCNINKNANGAEIVTYEGEAGFALDGTNGDVFVRIPKFAYERYTENGYEYRVVSKDGVCVHPAFVENGVVLDEIFISAFEGYVGSDDKLHSIGGVIPTSNITPQAFLDYAQANGDHYSLYDARCVDAVWTLMCIEYGCRNTNRFLGYGLANFEQPVSNTRCKAVESASASNSIKTPIWTSTQKGFLPIGGNITICKGTQTNILTQAKLLSCEDTVDEQYTIWTFDGDGINIDMDCFIGSAAFSTNFCEDAPSGALNWHTGRTIWKTGEDETLRNAIRYRWIENVFGNLWQYLPDVTFNDLQMYVCNSMKDYVFHKIVPPYNAENALFVENDDNGQKSDITGYNYWITNLDACDFTKGIDFGRAYDKSLTSNKAFGGYYYLYDGKVCIANGGGFDHAYRCNPMTQRAWIEPSSRWYLYGARLMYKHI